MSNVVPHKRAIAHMGRIKSYRDPSYTLHFGDGHKPVIVSFSDESSGRGTCLGCHDAPCMLLSPSDTILPAPLDEFPGDPSREVCPTRALSWSALHDAVQVDQKMCIGCGLCIARCPYGALSVGDDDKAIIEHSDPDGIATLPGNTDIHVIPSRTGVIASVSSTALTALPDFISDLTDIECSQFVRNLFLACGISCRTRRRGDTNVRMDGAVHFADGLFGVVEIETSLAVLDSPRALLEDVAVAHSRFGIPLDRIYPISVITRFPNERSEYFQVIDDIHGVLGVRCRTVTIGTLLVLTWNFCQINSIAAIFETTAYGTNLQPAIREHVLPTLPKREPYPGAYQPSK